jgi:type VI secretion system protein ImpJ
MNNTTKVLWGEGLFLRPQHFQQQDRYHETRLHTVATALHPYAWGVAKIQVDREALANNILRLQEFAAIFPDGEQYAAPANDSLPDTIALNDIPQTLQTITYYAAIPMIKAYGENFSATDQPNAAARYSQINLETPDLFTQAVRAELTYLKKSVRLVSELDPRDSLISFPLLRLRRASSGGFEIDPAFVPPSITIRSAPILMQLLRRLLDALQAKVNALYGHHREPSKNVIEFRSGDIASFWLLHTTSAGYASLSHYLNNPQLPPERLFEQLLNLAGGLMTFSKNHVLNDLPAYQHLDTGSCFLRLDSLIRELLNTVISTRYFAIALSETRPSYHQGQLDSGKIDDKTAFYLAVSASIPAAELVDTTPVRFKIGAPEDVDKLVLSAMPGVKLIHAPQVPAAIPVRPDTYYFALDNKSPLYARMLQAQAISIFAPSGIPDLHLEFLAVTS